MSSVCDVRSMEMSVICWLKHGRNNIVAAIIIVAVDYLTIDVSKKKHVIFRLTKFVCLFVGFWWMFILVISIQIFLIFLNFFKKKLSIFPEWFHHFLRIEFIAFQTNWWWRCPDNNNNNDDDEGEKKKKFLIDWNQKKERKEK